MDILFGIFILLFLDVVLSVDNAILIASTTKELEGNSRKWAQILGASGAVLLRLIFVVLILFVLKEASTIPFLYIIGGGILLFIGIAITNIKSENEERNNGASTVLKAVALIIAGDILMSFDNAFIIANVSINMGLNQLWTITVIAIALIISLVIILFFAKQLANIMESNAWIIYVAGWLLVSVGIEMCFKDELLSFMKIAHSWTFLISYSLGGLIIFVKWYLLDKNKKEKEA